MACTKQPQLIRILVDDREKIRPDYAAMDDVEEVITTRLETGDFSTTALRGRVAVERKSILDLCGSILTARFRKELERSRELDEFHIVVSGSLSAILDHPWGSTLPRSVKEKIRVTGKLAVHKLVDFAGEYGLKVWFCDTEAQAARMVVAILKSAERRLTSTEVPS